MPQYREDEPIRRARNTAKNGIPIWAWVAIGCAGFACVIAFVLVAVMANKPAREQVQDTGDGGKEGVRAVVANGTDLKNGQVARPTKQEPITPPEAREVINITCSELVFAYVSSARGSNPQYADRQYKGKYLRITMPATGWSVKEQGGKSVLIYKVVANVIMPDMEIAFRRGDKPPEKRKPFVVIGRCAGRGPGPTIYEPTILIDDACLD